MKKISWTDRVKNEIVKEEGNIVYKIKRRKSNWIGHILCRNCLPQHVIGRKIEEKNNGKARKEI
jgi:hypothetical protein